MSGRGAGGMNIQQLAYGLFAEWMGGRRDSVIRALATTPRFEAVLQVIEMLKLLESRPEHHKQREDLLIALEVAAQLYPGEPVTVTWTNGAE